MGKKNKKLNLDKNLLFHLYYNQKKSTTEIGKELNCSSVCVKNYMKQYGFKRRTNSESVKIQRTHWSQEQEDARTRKYLITWSNKTDEEKRAQIKNMHQNANTPNAIAKARMTKLKHNSYTKSKAEDTFYKKLKLFIDNDDIIRGYIDPRYPFNCDFYIKSKDLFIEYQGHWTHGDEPFDSTNINHINYVSYMQLKNKDMSTWYIRDVKKLNKAKESKINLLLVYPNHVSYLIINGDMINIGIFDIAKINDLCK